MYWKKGVLIVVLNTVIGIATIASAWQTSMELGPGTRWKDAVAVAIGGDVVVITKSISVIMTIVLVQINVTTRRGGTCCV